MLETLVEAGGLPLAIAAAVLSGLVLFGLSAREIVNRRRLLRRLKVAPAVRPTSAAGPGAEARPRPSQVRRAVDHRVDTVVDRAGALGRDGNPDRVRQLRMRLIRAGIFDPRAPAVFLLARFAGLALGVGAMIVWSLADAGDIVGEWMWIVAAAAAGYLAPDWVLARRTKRAMEENRLGFPDFMDLMAVCANAGLSMEAAIERVSRELADMYPTLGVHLSLLCLEVRAGRPIEEALNGLGHRTNLAEVRSFATLLQQSKELGSSLSDALRVFSEDMRHKRLALAEEKAYALPAKLSVPVTACILPVVIVVAILPIIVRFNTGIE